MNKLVFYIYKESRGNKKVTHPHGQVTVKN